MNRKRISLIDQYIDAVYGTNSNRDQEWSVQQWKNLAQDLLRQRNNLIELQKYKQQKENEKVQD